MVAAKTARGRRSHKQALQTEVISAFDYREQYDLHLGAEDLHCAVDCLDILIERANKLRRQWMADIKEEHGVD